MVKHPVDLATLDRDLEDVMITDYIGNIYEENHYRDTSDPDVTVYRFFELEKDTLLKFLEDYNHKFEYEVLDSRTGELIVVNKIDRSKANWMKFIQVMTSSN